MLRKVDKNCNINAYYAPEIETKLKHAILELISKEPDLHCFTSSTGQTEWNICAHLAPEIAKGFPGYSYDLDVTKHDAGNKRPDIVIHKRAIHSFNLLVIEVKNQGKEQDIARDEEKIQKYWFKEPYEYYFGAIINFPYFTKDFQKIELKNNLSKCIRVFERDSKSAKKILYRLGERE